jgi:hypothetical protein
MSKKNKAPVRLLSRADLRDRGITYSPTYLREMWMKGRFPRPQKLSPHSSFGTRPRSTRGSPRDLSRARRRELRRGWQPSPRRRTCHYETPMQGSM